MRAGRGAPPKRARLDRSTVVVAAQQLLDERGAAEFSMTRLGERLGVTAMALYRHVADRDDLERAVVELVLGELTAPSTVADWDAGVAEWMRSVRRCWIAHPWVGGMLGTAVELSPPWVAAVDQLAALLDRAGLRSEVLAHELVQISRSTIGLLWLEVNAPLPEAGLSEEALSRLPATSQRRWRGLTKALQRYDNVDAFDDLVTATLDRLRRASANAQRTDRHRGPTRRRGVAHAS
jgi:AcrR family transcriptional regulator